MKQILLFALTATIAFASITSHAMTKDQACEAYFASVNPAAPGSVPDQLSAITKVLNVAFELNYDDTKLAKLNRAFTNIVAGDDHKLIPIGLSAYFACTVELTPEDKAMGQKQMEQVLEQQ